MNLESLKSKLSANFSANLNSEVLMGQIEKFLDKEKNQFNYQDFMIDQKKKVYERKSDENSILFNEALELLINFLEDKEDEMVRNEKFIQEIIMESDVFNYSRSSSSQNKI